MKKIFDRAIEYGALTVLWVLLGFILLTGGMTSCASTNRNTYKIEQAATVTAIAAMDAWNSYVGEFNPPLSQERKVKAMWQKYQKAILAVTSAGAAYSATNSATDEEALNVAIQEGAKALADLVALLREFGVKI